MTAANGGRRLESKGAQVLTRRKQYVAAAGAAVAVGAAAIGLSVSSASPSAAAAQQPASSPIKHVVVLYDENISFDHYFGTYPHASNPPHEPKFTPALGTPNVNGLNNTLLTANPNSDLPARLDRTQAVTCDQNHGYSAEQAAFDSGLMDKFVQDTTGSGCSQSTFPNQGDYGPNGIVMDYYDGNTVTGLWNYAQHYTLNDNSYDSQFGPSTPGAINLVSGQTNGAVVHGGTSGNVAHGTLIGDAEPLYDQCSNASPPLSADGTPGGVTASFTGKNIGDLMNQKGVTWGWFHGGFAPSSISNGRAICGTQHTSSTRTSPAPRRTTTSITTSRSSTTPAPPTPTTWHRARCLRSASATRPAPRQTRRSTTSTTCRGSLRRSRTATCLRSRA
jgi:phospholipase C